MLQNYDAICAIFPCFERCSRERYIEIITGICSSWSISISRRVRKHQPSQPSRQAISASPSDDYDMLTSTGDEDEPAIFRSSGSNLPAHPVHSFQQALLSNALPAPSQILMAGLSSMSQAPGPGTGVTMAASGPPARHPTPVIAATTAKTGTVDISGTSSPIADPAGPYDRGPPGTSSSAGEAVDWLLFDHWAGFPQLQAVEAEAMERYCRCSLV